MVVVCVGGIGNRKGFPDLLKKPVLKNRYAIEGESNNKIRR